MPLDQPQPPPRKKLKRIEGQNHARALNWSCYRNQQFLTSDRPRRWLVEAIDFARIKYDFHLWAWCIMPTHVHLLIYPTLQKHACSASKHATPIQAILSAIKQSVAKRAIAWSRDHSPRSLERMRHEAPSGAVTYRFWQRGGGYDRNLFDPSAIHEMVEYIHQNPVEEGLCAQPTDWPWSSAITFEDSAQGALRLNLESMPVADIRPGGTLLI